MPNFKLFHGLFCGLLLAVGTVDVYAEDQPKSAAKPIEGKLLFDGKTLTNWKQCKFRGDGKVEVKEGALSIGTGGPMNGIVWDGAALPKVNYEVTWEARRVEGQDFFCALTFPVQDSPCTLVLGGWGGMMVGLSSLDGSDASENETSQQIAFEQNHWYKMRLRVTEEKIQAWLDEKALVDVDYQNRRVSIRIEVEPCRPFGISTYRTTGEIRELRLRDVK